MKLGFRVEHCDAEVVLVLCGELDLSNAAAVRSAMASLAAAAEGRRAVVDLAAVSFMDSSGVHAIVDGSSALGSLPVLRHPSRQMRRLLDIAVPGVFMIEDTDHAGASALRVRSLGSDAVVLETSGMATPDRKAAMSQDPRAEALSALSQFIVAETSVGDTLQRIADIAMSAVPAATVVGLTMLGSGGQPTTGIYTDPTSPEIDEWQYRSGRGPCLDAWRTRTVVRVNDMDIDGERYPECAEAARRHGIFSILSLPLLSGGEGLGALNLYAPRKAAFTTDDEALGSELAVSASVVLANTSAYWDAFEQSQHLNEAMKSRAVIEQAKGMLMAHSNTLSADDAFELLKKASQRENVKLRDIAQRVVDRQLLQHEI